MLNNLTQDVIAEVRALTDGRGADAAIVAAPVKSAQAQAVEIVRKRGRIGLFGGLPKDDPITAARQQPHSLQRDQRDRATSRITRICTPVALDLLDRGLIEADKIITATYPLEQVLEAFQRRA